MKPWSGQIGFQCPQAAAKRDLRESRDVRELLRKHKPADG
jgi:hypothetical protein